MKASTRTLSRGQILVGLAALLAGVFLVSVFLSRYPGPGLMTLDRLASDELARSLVFNLRLPRLLTAVMLGYLEFDLSAGWTASFKVLITKTTGWRLLSSGRSVWNPFQTWVFRSRPGRSSVHRHVASSQIQPHRIKQLKC